MGGWLYGIELHWTEGDKVKCHESNNNFVFFPRLMGWRNDKLFLATGLKIPFHVTLLC